MLSVTVLTLFLSGALGDGQRLVDKRDDPAASVLLGMASRRIARCALVTAIADSRVTMRSWSPMTGLRVRPVAGFRRFEKYTIPNEMSISWSVFGRAQSRFSGRCQVAPPRLTIDRVLIPLIGY
jgi:hypothetical protein